MKRKNLFIYTFIVIICLLLLYTLSLDSVLGSRISNIITVITAIIKDILLYKATKKLDLYSKGHKDIFTEDDYYDIVAYLEWLEELATIVNQNLIDFEFIDDYLSYRFFLITNNKYVQDIELINEYENYRGIYKMHKSWTQYKRKNQLPILQEKTSLNKTKNYYKN